MKWNYKAYTAIVEQHPELEGKSESVALATWPEFDPELLVESSIEIAVQIMGKVRGTIVIPADADQDAAVAIARANEDIERHLEGKTIRKIIFVPGRILNFVAN